MRGDARKRKPRTRLARIRIWRGVSQRDLAAATGISLSTIRRIESGEQTNPQIRYLTNIAAALHCPLETICEHEWLDWTVFDQRAAKPPKPREFIYHSDEWGPPDDLE